LTTARTTSPAQLCAHNIDAILALAALPVFAVTGLPLEGWFWACALWAVNRYAQSAVERRAARMGALQGVGTLGASMLLRPWIGMLILFLITRHSSTMLISSVLLFLLLLTVDILTRVVTHRNVGSSGLGGTA
jgi:uncharacterized protein YqgC (DUF456 family)